jgi:hypothetical protein
LVVVALALMVQTQHQQQRVQTLFIQALPQQVVVKVVLKDKTGVMVLLMEEQVVLAVAVVIYQAVVVLEHLDKEMRVAQVVEAITTVEVEEHLLLEQRELVREVETVVRVLHQA